MTYDPADGYVVLLGAPVGPGGYYTGGPTQLWKFAGGNWSRLTPSILPEFCAGSALAYDDHDGYVVFLGGPNIAQSGVTCASANQTWTYHAGAWTHLNPATSPPGRYGASLANDSKDGYLVLFGGEANTCYPQTYGWCGDTWKFAGGSWTNITSTGSPSPRGESGIAYDASDGYVVLFGGAGPNGALNDTWTFSNGSWTQLHPATSPPTPTPDAFSYDSSDSEIVYTDGWQNKSATVGSEIVWTFHAGIWTKAASGPYGRLGAATSDDPRDGYLVFFGGLGTVWNFVEHDTWKFHANVWTNLTPVAPSPRQDAALAYDTADGYAVLFGGTPCGTHYWGGGGSSPQPCGDTWSYRSGQWSPLSPASSPPARYGAGMVYDAADGYVVLFGGTNLTGTPLGDTWEFTGGSWTKLTPTASPSPRGAQNMVYDGADGYVLLFGGSSANYRDTWTFHSGIWTNRSASLTLTPPSDAMNPMVYDAADGYVLLFGTYQVPTSTNGYVVSANQSWQYLGGKWKNLTSTVGTAPVARTSASLAYDPTSGTVVLFGGLPDALDNRWFGDTWTFSAATWTLQHPTLSPNPRSDAAFAWDSADARALLVGGWGGGPQPPTADCSLGPACDDVWAWESGVGSNPFIGSFRASAPSLDIYTPVTLTVTASGGVPPFNFTYTGLPAGCSSVNASSLTCRPSAFGAFAITITVKDSAGNSTSASLTVQVNPSPSVSSFGPSPGTIALGSRTVFGAVVLGGTSPYTYVYTGLPPGCSSQTVPALPCVPTSAGNYTVRVNVTDADGINASANATLAVTPVGGGSAPTISQFGAAPSALVLGNSTNLTVRASGGVGYLSYGFTGLPAGCASANVSVLACTPTASGVFQVTVDVADSRGTAAVATNLTVYPAGGGAGVLVTAYGATPAVVPAGQPTEFIVTASGGTGTLSYQYAGLPSGCPTHDLPILSCTPSLTAVGSYRVEAIVSDSAGHRTGVLASLLVTEGVSVPTPLSIVAFFADPGTVAAGGQTVLRVFVHGGAGALSYRYAGLPPGCASTSTPTLTCTPASAGNYSVRVAVADATGATASSTAALDVLGGSAGPPRSGSGASASGWSPFVALSVAGVGALVSAGLVALILRRRAKRAGPPGERAPPAR